MTQNPMDELPPIDEWDLLRSICRSSFKQFVREFVATVIPGGFKWNWHIDVICEILQDIAERVFRGEHKAYDLIVNIPPGTSKSTLISILFPAWVWTRMPHARFICVSYADNLALDLSRRGRDVILSDKYRKCFPEIELREDQSTKHQWGNTLGGMRSCAGSNGSVHGMHAHFIIPDDPINPNMAISIAEIFKVNYWMSHTLATRWVDKNIGVTIIVMQRLAVDDPTGMYLERGGVRHICIPAADEGFEIKPPELKHFYVDKLMDPGRMSRAWLDQQRGPHGMGEQGYAAQFGQSPLPLGGGKFKVEMIGWGPIPPQFKKLVRAWDKAVTPEKGSASLIKGPAFTVGFLMGLDMDDNIWFLDVIRKRMESSERERRIQHTARKDGRGVNIIIEEEPGSGGKDSALGTARRLMGYKVSLVRASGSKDARAEQFAASVGNGLCFIPDRFRKGTTWIGWAAELIQEMKYYPYAPYSDQVDAGSHAFTALTTRRPVVGGLVGSRH